MKASNAPEDELPQLPLLALERSPKPLPPPGGAHFVGPETCRTCHQVQYDLWRDSRHSHSYDTLLKQGEQATSMCLRCHTTGFPEESGFSTAQATPHLAAVTCEACHGPGSVHVEERQQGGEVTEYGNVNCPRCQAARICVLCHREPTFDAKSMLEQIGCTRGYTSGERETETSAEGEP